MSHVSDDDVVVQQTASSSLLDSAVDSSPLDSAVEEFLKLHQFEANLNPTISHAHALCCWYANKTCIF
jgi:hypothetical protein